ncbi:MAG: hypothetical protein DWQ47_17500 [Acidobacteria bacterium]|nr:MAG: hypothetical protein DWQ32_04900 [Acidobacteriota bacterium]REK02165.1 MAG: hypothetical protein DWQ38_07255 [Acidobacteriota bacterium]REK14033.1 MAG: hypothetical protein DWQ43_10590 [Acidobacteriota bacterium]REK42028.1 MAG: hypothetical protein DWQ47_17500 [Acidobacteriota bacterium]
MKYLLNERKETLRIEIRRRKLRDVCPSCGKTLFPYSCENGRESDESSEEELRAPAIDATHVCTDD